MHQTVVAQAELSSWLIHLSRAWRRRVNEHIASDGLSEATALPLLTVYRLGAGVRQVALAEAIGIEGPSLVRLLDQLCAAGLLQRREDSSDRRAKTVVLTKAGRQLAIRIEQRLVELREATMRDLDPAAMEVCLGVLRTLGATLGTGTPPISRPYPATQTVPEPVS